MTLQVDSREKPRATKAIFKQFQEAGTDFFVSKLFIGDYMSYDNPRLVIDRKQSLTELCINCTSDHDRFRAELIRAQAHGIQVIILCEHGEGIRTLEDVRGWNNPRGTRRHGSAPAPPAPPPPPRSSSGSARCGMTLSAVDRRMSPQSPHTGSCTPP